MILSIEELVATRDRVENASLDLAGIYSLYWPITAPTELTPVSR
jgi:hypothetical protein